MSHHNFLFLGNIYPGGAGLGARLGKPGKSGAPKQLKYQLSNVIYSLKPEKTPTNPFSVYVSPSLQGMPQVPWGVKVTSQVGQHSYVLIQAILGI